MEPCPLTIKQMRKCNISFGNVTYIFGNYCDYLQLNNLEEIFCCYTHFHINIYINQCRFVYVAQIMLAIVPDNHFQSMFGSEPNCSQIGGLGCKYTRTSNWSMVQGQSPNLSELGRLLVGFPVGPSVDSFNAVVFAVSHYSIAKIMDSTSSNHLLHILRFALSTILHSMVFLLYFVLLPIKTVNCSVMSSNIRVIPSLPTMQDQKLLTLC